jgi:hypothetical protein
MVTSITGMTLTTDTEGRCLNAERRSSTTSRATRHGMEKATWARPTMKPAGNTPFPDIEAAAAAVVATVGVGGIATRAAIVWIVGTQVSNARPGPPQF